MPALTSFVVTLACFTIAGNVPADEASDVDPVDQVPVVRVLTATTVTDPVEGVSISVELSNPHDDSVSFLGYTPDSFDPPLKEGQISPIYRIEFQRDGEWVAHPLGWCGFGMDSIELKPDAKPTFSAFAAGAGKWDAVRVGISHFDLTETDEPPPVVWSAPHGNEPPVED